MSAPLMLRLCSLQPAWF